MKGRSIRRENGEDKEKREKGGRERGRKDEKRSKVHTGIQSSILEEFLDHQGDEHNHHEDNLKYT